MPSAQGSSSSSSAGSSGIPQPPPGMSFYAAKRVIGDSPWTPEQLEQVMQITWPIQVYEMGASVK